MILSKKTLEKFRSIINEESEYRSGPELVKFFNLLGSHDTYPMGGGFPSRWKYTDDKLEKINGTPEIDKCIKMVFKPVNFADRLNELDKLIGAFNQFLRFDNWKVARKGTDIIIEKSTKDDFNDASVDNEKEFLNKEIKLISLDMFDLDPLLLENINYRLEEIQKCLNSNIPLSVIFLTGSSLEGILLGFANKYIKLYNQCSSAPKDRDGKVKKTYDWSLKDFIDTSNEIGILKDDVKKFSHILRDFRNYIHPYHQFASKFFPDNNTAILCWQVFKVALNQLYDYSKSNKSY